MLSMTDVTVWDYINFFMSPIIVHFFLATDIYFLFQDIPFFHHIVHINNINPAAFHFHTKLIVTCIFS
jgi:hypothetical protein